jgi:ribosome biogenesis GTPase
VKLEQFGWNSFFANQASREVCGRVACSNHGLFLVWTEAGEVEASASGVLRKSSSLWPAVGDWVVLREDTHAIVKVLERETRLRRKQPEREVREQVLAANVDVLFIVSGLDRDYNERRIERYLVMANESGARPVVLLNKTDLVPELGLDLAEVVGRVQQMSPGMTVIALSAWSEHGLDALPAEVMPGQTAALIGSSGVGKSTILNRLLGEDRQRTTPVRAADSRGRHTTVGRQIFLMPEGWLLMDMPGLREIQLWTSTDRVDDSFEDIQQLAEACRFRDCRHGAEPGCAVAAAGVDTGRLANYLKMYSEVSKLDNKAATRSTPKSYAKGKAASKPARGHAKDED